MGEFKTIIKILAKPRTFKNKTRPTKRAPDGWWAPGFGLDSSEKFGSVSLVGSPSRR
jgi:hypothetical protein